MKKTKPPTTPQERPGTIRRYLRHRKPLEGLEGLFAVVILAVVCVWTFWRVGSGLPTSQATPETTPRPTPTMIMPTPAPITAPVPLLAEIVPDQAPVATPPEPTPTAVDQWALDVAPVPWLVNCENEVAWDGYIVPEFGDYCVPGLLTRRTLNIQFPHSFYGVLSSYGPYQMEYMEDRAGVRRGTGVALTTCGMMGYTVWLSLPGEAWRGPFRVVDCGAPAHTFYQVAVQGLAVEIGYSTAQSWVPAAQRVDVQVGSFPGAGWDGLYLTHWWVDNALQWETGYPLLQHTITRTDGTTFLWPELE